jgi:hypothetical protein
MWLSFMMRRLVRHSPTPLTPPPAIIPIVHCPPVITGADEATSCISCNSKAETVITSYIGLGRVYPSEALA